jgi:tripartite-type tricarboxylate transporter receptor subunit TctC
MKALVLGLVALAFGVASARAQDPVSSEPVSFKNKTITMIIGSDPGGGTDASGRVLAQFLGNYLPGKPTVVVQNMPGAGGITAMNYIFQRVKPDGLTIIMGSNSTVDPLTFRRANANYDPAKIPVVGGVGRGGTVVVIAKDAERRLYDPKAKPVIMGSNEAVPRSSMQVTLWGVAYLGWNAKWITGYPGTNEVMLALARGEVDMTSTGNMFQIGQYTKTGKFAVLNQSGAMEGGRIVARPDFGEAPLFPDLMKGKIKDPVAQEAFDYWLSINAMDKWLALPPGVSDAVLATYRDAFGKMTKAPDFVALGKKISDDFTPMTYQDVGILMKTLANTPNEATGFTKTLMRNQGITVD